MIIEVTDLTKSYNRKRVVKKINFSVQKGEIFGILGPNGAGKSTTLEMIEALRQIDGGKVTLNGIDVASEPSKIKHIIGIQLQSTSFANRLTLVEQLNLFASLYGEKIDAMKLLKKVQLTDKAKSYVEQL